MSRTSQWYRAEKARLVELRTAASCVSDYRCSLCPESPELRNPSSWVPCIWGQPLKKYQTDMSDRRFPAPWKVEKIAGGFKVIDANGQSLAYVYSRETKDAANIAGVLAEDEARRIASNIAKLPELLGATDK